MIITDPDSFVRSSTSGNLGTDGNIWIDTATKTVFMDSFGDLDSDGATEQSIYSYLKEEWKSDSTLIKFPFPMTPITDEQFEMVNGWDWGDDTTRYLIRNGGWAVKNDAGVSLEEWAGIISLGSIGSTDQPYFQQEDGGSATDFELTGAVNQAVKIYGDATHGNFDYRDTFNVFVREQGKTYAQSTLSDIGVTTLSYQAYRFPLANADDTKITADDTAISTTAPYTGMSITWYETAQERTIGSTAYDFHVIIDANSGTLEQVYEFVQYQLRQDADIDAGAGTQTGKVTSALSRFVGDNFYTLINEEGGVYVDNFLAADTNRLYVTDDTGTVRTFPYVAALNITIGDNLSNDADAVYRVFFTNDDAGDNLGYDYGTANAIIVNDNDDTPMSGDISGSSTISLTFDYDGNVQRGTGSDGEDAPITVVGIGLSTGQFVKATTTLTRSTSNAVSLVAALERQYENAA